MARLLLALVAFAPFTTVVSAQPGLGNRVQAGLGDDRATDADVRALATKSPGFQDLDIGWPGMTDSALKEVAKLTTIETLHIRNASIYSRDGRVRRVAGLRAGRRRQRPR